MRPRWRQRHDDDATTDRVFETTERSRARTRADAWRWPGAVEVIRDSHSVRVPGTWMLDEAPSHRHGAVSLSESAPIPDVADNSAAWVARMRRVLWLEEPGTRLRVGDVNESGWQTLEISVPTRPVTIVQVDRESLASLLGGAVAVRLTIES